ncbi:MAG: WXG100 family type VII secretion target [Peptococcaceae bacterium]|nr:WXG100 family type VII secretion target [Peptococcaceae bacterium]
MSDRIRVDTDQVGQIATNIERYNAQLDEALKKGQVSLQNLSSVWSGRAADDTINSFKSFVEKYSQLYHDMMDNYVKFLRLNIQSGYFETEQANIGLADMFK